MSITDELREWAVNHRAELDMGQLYPAMIEGIADRIDAEHERALRETGEEIVGDVRKEWIPLPVDADGIPVHIGDVMEWARVEDDGLTIVREVSAVGNGVFFAWSDEQHRYAQYESHAYRHHHAPTVEDVLREFAHVGIHIAAKHGIKAGEIDFYADEEAIAEYAAKLREALDA